MKRSACLIFNPVAGQGNPEQELAQICQLLEPEIDLEICLTTPELDADHLAREAVQRGVETVLASGGDGTLSAVATALVGTDIPLGIISRGTANAFAAALDIPTTIAGACETILQGHQRRIDAARCSQQDAKPQLMILLAGIGFEAEAVERADRQAKNRFGVMAYILAGLQQWRQLETFDVEIETVDRVIKTTAAAVTVANAAPPTSILAQGPGDIAADDGLLDITIVAPATRVGALAATYHLFQTASAGDAVSRDDIGYLRTQTCQIRTDPPQKVVVDGELLGYTPLEITCLPQALSIFVPATQAVEPEEKLEGLPNLVVETKEPQPQAPEIQSIKPQADPETLTLETQITQDFLSPSPEAVI